MSKKDKKKNEQKPKQPAKVKGKGTPARIPFLLDFTLSFSRLLVLLAGLLTVALAYTSGASLEILAFRAGVVMLATGLLAWLGNWLLARKFLAINQAQLKELLQEARASSTVEKEA